MRARAGQHGAQRSAGGNGRSGDERSHWGHCGGGRLCCCSRRSIVRRVRLPAPQSARPLPRSKPGSCPWPWC